LNCAAPIAPTGGVVTSFSDWNATATEWGTTPGLTGGVFSYAGGTSTSTVTVDTAAMSLHAVGMIVSGSYAGAGLVFYSCVTAATDTSIQFTIAGSMTCVLEQQLQTYSQRPTTETPPGGCTTSCQNYPKFKPSPGPTVTATPTTVTVPFSSLTPWTAATSPGEIVGVQWQFTNASGGSGCTFDVHIDDVRFVP
jgi:hypothetical protein